MTVFRGVHRSILSGLLGHIARTLKRPLSFTVEQVDQAPDRWREMLDAIAGWNAEGLDVKAQVAPRPIGLAEVAGLPVEEGT